MDIMNSIKSPSNKFLEITYADSKYPTASDIGKWLFSKCHKKANNGAESSIKILRLSFIF